jgi:insertion element IS1 protein InsB
MDPREIRVEIHQVEEAEIDEMWSFVTKKSQQRWLWHAIDHRTGIVLAYVLGTHQDEVFLQWKALLAPLGIHHFYTDGADVYNRHLTPEQHTVGKRQTQKIERKHLTFRTRLKRFVRKTICFSKSMRLHDIVIGLFVNRYEFGLLVWKR